VISFDIRPFSGLDSCQNRNPFRRCERASNLNLDRFSVRIKYCYSYHLWILFYSLKLNSLSGPLSLFSCLQIRRIRDARFGGLAVDLQAIFYHRLLQMLSPFGLSLQLLSRYSVCSWSLVVRTCDVLNWSIKPDIKYLVFHSRPRTVTFFNGNAPV
jgi:hypothetical protein